MNHVNFLTSSHNIVQEALQNTSNQNQINWTKLPVKTNNTGLLIGKYKVVEFWEEEVQKRMASIACKKCGNILEIGYGLGLASKQVLQESIHNYTVIEAHPIICNEIKQNNNINLIENFWENEIENLSSNFYSGIIFDAYPLDGLKTNNTTGEVLDLIIGYEEEFNRILKKNGTLCMLDFSNNQEMYIEKLNTVSTAFSDVHFHKIALDIPIHCNYAVGKSAAIIEFRK